MSRAGDVRRETVLPGGRTFQWRSATPDDAQMIWEWWTAPGVSYWSIDARLSKVQRPPYDHGAVRDYLGMPQGERRVDPIIGILDRGAPKVYAELYAKKDSLLAACPLVEGDARGSHFLVDPIEGCDRWTVFEICVDGVDWQFSEWPTAEHYIGDPDIRNRPAVFIHQRLGMRPLDTIQLPYKTAYLMAIGRDEWKANHDKLDALMRRETPA